MRKHAGFTTIELVIGILFLAALGTLFMFEKQEIDAIQRDAGRKTAINAIYYNLEEAYFPANKSYPRILDSTKLKAIDPALLKDPEGRMVGEQGSDYRYEPTGCSSDSCAGYTLRTKLEKEGDFIREDRQKQDQD